MGCCGGGHGHAAPRPNGAHKPQETAGTEDPMAILKTRLAKGEITLEEYERLAAILQR